MDELQCVELYAFDEVSMHFTIIYIYTYIWTGLINWIGLTGGGGIGSGVHKTLIVVIT